MRKITTAAKNLFDKYFQWDFDNELEGKHERGMAFRNAFHAEGFKELLADYIYYHRQLVVESKTTSERDIYYAECLSWLLSKMVAFHKELDAPTKPEDKDEENYARLY